MRVENISRFKKERFLKGLTEDDFRDRVIRPLMLRTGYTDGRDLCGPSEHGKDAIFVSVDALGISTVIAVQTKKGNLNLSGTTQRNLIDALTQLRTALDTSVVFIETKCKHRPNRVVLAASGKINDAARNHIVDEIKSPNITFWDAESLIPKIDEHLPELWLGIEADMLPYFNAILRLVIGEQADSQDSLHDGILSGAADDKNFVTLSLLWTTTKKRKIYGEYKEEPRFEEIPLSAIINHKARRVLVLGEGGSGKSTGLKRIALELARRGLTDDSKTPIPVLMKAVEILRSNPKSLVSYADEVARSLAGSANSCFTDKDLSNGRVVLLIDGLDEIGGNADRSIVICLADRFLIENPRCQVIVTSRPYRFISELASLRRYEEFRVSPISWRQAEKIVRRVTESKLVPKTQADEFLRRLEKIHGFDLNPLLVTVFAATADFTKQDIPANITELFKKFTELMLGRWDEKKGLRQAYQAPLKDFVLTRLAFHMHSKRVASISKLAAIEIVRNDLITRGHEENVETLLDEIFNRSGIFRVMGTEVEFQHHLLQEFFAGRGIPDPQVVSQIIHEDWWKRALVFYFGERADNIALLSSVAKATQELTAGRMVEVATTVGLALQACYLSPIDDKLEIWKWVVRALDASEQAAITADDVMRKYPMSSYFHYYLYARDSVSLSHLRNNLADLVVWAKSPTFGDNHSSDNLLYWLIIGLVEAGDISYAESLVKDFSPRDTRLLAAIHLGCHLANTVRPLPEPEKEAAKRICASLAPHVMSHILQIRQEMGSVLLELRNGAVAHLDEESVEN